MITNVLLQLLSIACSIGILWYVGYEHGHKKYSYWYILIRYVRFKDTEPLKWLLERKYLIALWFLAIGQLLTISGLLREFGLGRINGKPFEFFLSAPMTKICIIFLIHEVVKAKSPAYSKRVNQISLWTSNMIINKLK